MIFFDDYRIKSKRELLEERSIFFDKKTRKAYNQEYKYRDRFRFGITFRSLDLILSNLAKRSRAGSDYSVIWENLLKMVDRCKSIEDVEYLRRDKNAAIRVLQIRANRIPEEKEDIEKHIHWLKTVYTEKLNQKAKELRGEN